MFYGIPKKKSRLGNIYPLDSKDPKIRLDDVWHTSLVSQRLVMFQVYFLTHVARPKEKSLEEVLSRYNYSYGRPNEAMKKKLHFATKYLVTKVNSWPAYFKFIGIPPPPNPTALVRVLNEAIVNSAKRGYHIPYRSIK